MLTNIRDRWIDVSALTDLIPEDRVIIGEPIPGTALVAIFFQGYTITKGVRSSAGMGSIVDVRFYLEALTPEALDEITAVILAELLPVETPYGVIDAVSGFSANVARDPASGQYGMEGTLSGLIL